MLDGYVSEKEQLETMRKWWNENGKFLLIAIIIGLAVGFAWKYWRGMQVRYAENAAQIYQSVLDANTQNNTVTAQGGAKILMQHYSSSPYASLAALLSAKDFVLANNLPMALSDLQWVVDHSEQKRLQQIARLSSARILLSQHKPQLAMTQLNTVNDKTFMPMIEWIKGDIYTAENDAKNADAAYLKAKDAFAGFPPAQNLLTQELAQPVNSPTKARTP